jgi:hypothetical protein
VLVSRLDPVAEDEADERDGREQPGSHLVEESAPPPDQQATGRSGRSGRSGSHAATTTAADHAH